MFLQDSKEGRKREHINNICARERKGPEGKLVRVSIRGKNTVLSFTGVRGAIVLLPLIPDNSRK